MPYKTEIYDGITYQMERIGNTFYMYAYDENGQEIGHGRAGLVQAHINGAVVKALANGAVATEPNFRRGGIARNCFRMLNSVIEEEDVMLSYLHPFSFNYYRTMGYERVADHRELIFPITTLSFLPRFTDMIRCKSTDDAAPITEAYHRFCQGRNILFRRDGATCTLEPKVLGRYMSGGIYEYNCKDHQIFYSKDENGNANGYLILRRAMEGRDHMLFGEIQVEELGFDSPQTLRNLLGFLRVYEGEVDRVKICNCAMAPEVEKVLKGYKYTDIRVVADLQARIHNVEKLLAVMVYPKAPGAFTVKVTDCPKSPYDKEHNEGTWRVEYADGKATVTRLADSAEYDLSAPMPAFTQLIHGYESGSAQLARYMEGVELKNDCEDFFRAFPCRPNGLFELF